MLSNFLISRQSIQFIESAPESKKQIVPLILPTHLKN